MTEHEQGAEIAAAVGAAAGSTITRAEIVDDWLLALTFGDGSGQRLLVRAPWRLVNAKGLRLSSADDPRGCAARRPRWWVCRLRRSW